MFNVATIGESVKRHWLVIVVVTVLCVGVGAFSSYRSNSGEEAAKSYTAEAVLYVQDYGYGEDVREGGAYNYALSEGYMVSDARRVVVSNEVAGEVRRMYGSDIITVTSPRWRNTERNEDIDTRFVFVDVSAPSADVAKEAADKAAALAVEKIKETLPVESVTVSEKAYLKSVSGEYAGDMGADELVSDDDGGRAAPAVVAARSISFKTVFIYGFVGIVLSVAAFAAYDILTRRVRSPRDVERLLDVPVLETVRPSDGVVRLASSVKAVMEQNGFSSLAVVGATSADGADGLAQGLADILPDFAISSINFDADDEGVSKVRESQAALIVLKRAASKGSSIDAMMWRLRVADAPVVGAAFVSTR